MKLFTRDPYRKIVVAHRVIVNLKDETAISGYVTESTRGVLVMRGSGLLSAGAEPLSVSGDVVIDRENVSFIQIPPGSSKE